MTSPNEMPKKQAATLVFSLDIIPLAGGETGARGSPEGREKLLEPSILGLPQGIQSFLHKHPL